MDGLRIGIVYYGDLSTLTGGNLYDRKLIDHLEQQSIAVEHVSMARRSYLGSLAQNWSAPIATRFVRNPPDVLLQDELVHPSLFYSNRRLRSFLGCPLVAVVHHLQSSEAHGRLANVFFRQVERLYLSTMDGFIFNSETTRRAVFSLLSSKRPFVVAPPGGDRLAVTMTRQRVRARAREDPLKLLFVGNLIPRKGLHHLLRALEDLLQPAFRLEIVGSGSFDARYTASVRRLAARLGDRVRFHGTVADSELARLFASSQLFCVPSSYEGFGIAYLEALGWGLPVIASAAGGATEIIRPENGYLVTPGDTGALTAVIDRLIEDRELLSRLSLAALETHQAHPSWEDSMTAARNFLLDLLRSG